MEFDIQATTTEEGRPFGCLRVKPTLINRILEAQGKDEGLKKWFEKVSAEDPTEWSIGTDGGLDVETIYTCQIMTVTPVFFLYFRISILCNDMCVLILFSYILEMCYICESVEFPL